MTEPHTAPRAARHWPSPACPSSLRTYLAGARRHPVNLNCCQIVGTMSSYLRLSPLSLFLAVAIVGYTEAFSPSARGCASSSFPLGSKSDDNDNMTTLLIGSLNRIGTDASLILASQSPRRVEILDMMGLSGRFTQTPSPLDEEALQVELATQTVSPEDYAKILAERKAEALGLHMKKSSDDMSELTTFILGSDTIVDLNGHILNKPVDEADAVRMLQSLSGNWHRVHTGVALYKVCKSTEVTLVSSFTDTANVEFAGLSQEDIEAYVNTKEPLDKAGSYGIQGIGGQLVARMEGDFFTVMGLPMHRVSKALAEAMADL